MEPLVRRMLLIAVLVATAAAAPASSEPQRVAGTLALELTMVISPVAAACPSDVPQEDGTGCTERTGQTTARGLGRVTTVYITPARVGPPTCPANLGKMLSTTVRLVVAGKGEITLALAAGANCVADGLWRNEPTTFTVTGGTGAFGGASGGGRVERYLPTPVQGTETWTGTLVAPSHEFDLAPPKIAGARAKTVRAPKGGMSRR